MADTNITMVRGDTMSFGFEYDGTTRDLTAALFTCKSAYSGGTVIFQKSLSNGITKLATGKYVVRVAPADTRTLTPGIYYYDFQVTIDNDVFTPLIGTLTIEQDYS